MIADLPNLKDMDLFADICSELQLFDQPLKQVALTLDKSQSTISECITSLERHYNLKLVNKGAVAKPTKDADKVIAAFNQIVHLARTLGQSGAKKKYEIRVLTTRSLHNRLFSGPTAAFMMWMRRDQQDKDEEHRHTARVMVTACDHNELMARLTERGVNAYHWGVCWNLPQAVTNSYLDFVDIPLPGSEDWPHQCETPVVAITSDPKHGMQSPDLKDLFKRCPEVIDATDLWPFFGSETVAVVNTEPEDPFRTAMMGYVDTKQAITVPQYEDALYHVRSMDADLSFGPGWFRYRNHVETRYLKFEDEVHHRKVQMVLRKSLAGSVGGRQPETPLVELDRPIVAFYVIFRMFVSDKMFSKWLFANRGADPEEDKEQRRSDPPAGAVRGAGTRRPPPAERETPTGSVNRVDPAFINVGPAEIAEWLKRRFGDINEEIDKLKRDAVKM